MKRACTATIDVEFSERASLVMAEAVSIRPHRHERNRASAANWSIAGASGVTAGWPSRRRCGCTARSIRCWRGQQRADGAVALATVVVASGDERLVEKVRAMLDGCGSEAAISAWNGIAIVRLCAGDAALLRRDLVSVLNAVSGGLPRLWTS